jgi:hypothetical protein
MLKHIGVILCFVGWIWFICRFALLFFVGGGNDDILLAGVTASLFFQGWQWFRYSLIAASYEEIAKKS